jgi:hypothetical protein
MASWSRAPQKTQSYAQLPEPEPGGNLACEIREIDGLFCAIRENRFKIG